ncbi:Serin endopeptidase [Colletotrichum higginsianum IMI 349063]|uniref:Serin endopeptidase n=1 Tax=Colletotrichum higginsianum (strain IMI 349063) TaxID=759273 RepID=A0A1B7Y7I3_COLHI|nr:Serin endopeptidase [Colletotrichum higginsianum IMI 349063]OBR07989.1 Serin endopeptidase [Colletotrichum higginsianum IMI 349063]
MLGKYRYIIVLEETYGIPCTAASSQTAKIKDTNDSDINRVKMLVSFNASCAQSAKLQFRQVYENELFPGFSLDIENADGHGDYTQCLDSVSGVVRTWQQRSYLPASRNDSTTGANTPDQPVNASILHGITGVKDLHDAGIAGRGLTIAMIDTGVDYGHPALGDGMGEGYKIRYGIDLVGDNWQIGDAPRLDPDPYTECTDHGTHVSGIVAGNQSSLGFVGVASEANLEHYRVSGCNRVPIQSDIVIKAVLMAYSRKVDAVSLSLTLNTGPYPDDPLSEVLARISQEGNVLVVVASGNYGWQGPFSARAPASAPNVLAVGSVNSAYSVQSRPRASFSVDNATNGESQSTDFAWAPATPGRFPDSLSLQATTLDTSIPDDACSSSENDPPLSDTAVVLVRRGGCTFDVKMKNLAARGATYVLIYDNVDQPLFEFDNKFDEILGAGSVTAHVGNELMRALSEGSEVTLMMDSGFRGVPFIKVGENSLPPGQVNGRGSWGPTGLGDSMPSLLAPGQSIWSTIPRSWGGFGTLSGTSMAAPYIAGCAALVKQVHPGLSSSEISRLLTSTARPLNFNDGTNKTYNFLAPVAQQGNGVVDALGAVRTKTALSRSHLAWNDTDFFTGSASFEVQNKGNESAEYNFSHRPAVTVLALSPDGRSITPWTRDNSSSLASEEFLQNLLADRHADVTISPQSLRIGPGETALVRVTADIKTLDDLRSRCPLYSGFIYVNDGGSDDGLTISYMGIGCSMRRMVVMPPGWNKTFVTAATTKQAEGESYDAIPISPNTTFLLQGHQTPKMYLNTSTLLPTLNVELAMFSRALTVEVFPAAAADDDRGVSVFSPDQAAKPGGFGRSTTNLITWSGQLENGSWADEGLYKFKVCALRAWERTSGPQAQKDCVVTAPFGIEYDG